MVLIMFFIIILNIVAIALTYYCLSDMDKKEKIIFIAIGIAIIYLLTSLVYWISTKDIAIKVVSEMGKRLITFLFVPINGIIVLPILAKSYAKYKIGRLRIDNLKNRTLVLGVILVILLIIECTYFRDIQNSVVTMIEKNQEKRQDQNVPSISNELLNGQTNQMGNQISNEIENDINVNTVNSLYANQMSNKLESQILNEVSANQMTNNIR